jgi:hypothetical protein
MYTAPSIVTETHNATVMAKSVADSTVSASATVNLTTSVALNVNPSSGSVASGGTLQLTANVTGTSDTRVNWTASAGSISSTGLFTAPSVTSAATVTVTARSVADSTVSGVAQVQVTVPTAPSGGGTPTFLESGGQVTVEGEDGTIVNRAQQWVPQNSVTGFSGSAYVTSLPNSGNNYDAGYAGVAPEVQYRVKFQTSGTYYVWVRGYSTGPADDSVNVGLDGNAVSTGARLSNFTSGAWGWSNSTMDSTGRVTLQVATAGVHTVNLWMREDGFSVDKLVLSTSSSFTPTGLGPAESPTDSSSPVLSLSTANLAFSSIGGVAPASQTVAIGNLGGGSMSWTAQSGQNWLAVSPASGSNSGVLSISVNPSGLAVGNYSGTVTVTAAGASGSPKTIAVSLTVTAASAASLTVSGGSVNLSTTAGSNPSGQNVSIGGTSGLSWTAAKSQSWISLSAASGTTPATLTVGASASSMSAGTYTGTVTITAAGAGGSPATVNVTLTVSAVSVPPTPPATGSGRQLYVAPNGKSSGDGSIGNPWDLESTLGGSRGVKPGDTVWLRGGTYGGTTKIFNSRLAGTASAPIYVRQYPGERATIIGGIGTYSPYVWYWGFEIMNTNPDRSDTRSAPECFDTYDNSIGVKAINLILHDCGQGIGFWSYSRDSEVHGNIIFYNGWQGPGTDRGHGHGIYVQNQYGAKLISDNIIFDQEGLGIQAYGSGNAYLQNVTLDGNTVFNNGAISRGGKLVDNILVAIGSVPKNIVVKDNLTYHQPNRDDGYSRLGWSWSGTNENLIATGNYFIGGGAGEAGVEVWNWNSLTFTGNTVYTVSAADVILKSSKVPGYTWDNNRYYGAGKFSYNGTMQGWSAWKSATGKDANSTYTSGAPTGVWTMVRPNKYEPGRGNITIYNWDLRSSVDVDVSKVVSAGATYEVRDAQNFFGAPIATGTYNGGTISIPMTGLAKMRPVGSVGNIPPHSGPQFGAFVIFSK